MKAILNPVPQSNGHSFTIVESNPEKAALVVPLQTAKTSNVATTKTKPLTDAPENWDESWFANYE